MCAEQRNRGRRGHAHPSSPGRVVRVNPGQSTKDNTSQATGSQDFDVPTSSVLEEDKVKGLSVVSLNHCPGVPWAADCGQHRPGKGFIASQHAADPWILSEKSCGRFAFVCKQVVHIQLRKMLKTSSVCKAVWGPFLTVLLVACLPCEQQKHQ